MADKSFPNQVTELWELVVAYTKQETVEPIKNLGRFVKYGVLGSLALMVGLPLMVLGLLRAVQAESGDHLTGSLTFIPYLAAAALALLFAGMAAWGISRKKKKGAS